MALSKQQREYAVYQVCTKYAPSIPLFLCLSIALWLEVTKTLLQATWRRDLGLEKLRSTEYQVMSPIGQGNKYGVHGMELSSCDFRLLGSLFLPRRLPQNRSSLLFIHTGVSGTRTTLTADTARGRYEAGYSKTKARPEIMSGGNSVLQCHMSSTETRIRYSSFFCTRQVQCYSE